MRSSLSGNYWWFGINNKDERKSKNGHVFYFPRFKQFLDGIVKTYDWPQNIRNHRIDYEDMVKGDPILFWMGDGEFIEWGIIGFGYINNILRRGGNVFFQLGLDFKLNNTIKPYDNGRPKITENTEFLINTFSPNFPPLYKNFIQIPEYGALITQTPSIAITIQSIKFQQYKSCFEFARLLNSSFV
jgi:hypothetical protein